MEHMEIRWILCFKAVEPIKPEYKNIFMSHYLSTLFVFRAHEAAKLPADHLINAYYVKSPLFRMNILIDGP